MEMTYFTYHRIHENGEREKLCCIQGRDIDAHGREAKLTETDRYAVFLLQCSVTNTNWKKGPVIVVTCRSWPRGQV